MNHEHRARTTPRNTFNTLTMRTTWTTIQDGCVFGNGRDTHRVRCGRMFPARSGEDLNHVEKSMRATLDERVYREMDAQQTHTSTSTNHETKVTRCGARQDTNYGETPSISTKHMWCTTQAQLHPLVPPKDDNATCMRRQDTKKRGSVNNHKKIQSSRKPAHTNQYTK